MDPMKQLTNPVVKDVLQSKPPQKPYVDLKAAQEKAMSTPHPVVGKEPTPDYSKQPSPSELKIIENWRVIDEQSSKGWGPGGVAKKPDFSRTNELKAAVFDRIFSNGKGFLSKPEKQFKQFK